MRSGNFIVSFSNIFVTSSVFCDSKCIETALAARGFATKTELTALRSWSAEVAICGMRGGKRRWWGVIRDEQWIDPVIRYNTANLLLFDKSLFYFCLLSTQSQQMCRRSEVRAVVLTYWRLAAHTHTHTHTHTHIPAANVHIWVLIQELIFNPKKHENVSQVNSRCTVNRVNTFFY